MSPARKKPSVAADAAQPDAAAQPDEAASLPNDAAPQLGEAASSDATAAPTTPAAAPTTGATETCPWCSAKAPVGAATCPSCGASLRDAVDGDILGVTQIDPAAVSRASRIEPGRLARWLGAESTEGPDLGGNVEPPSKEVREEMLRLELAAIDAEIEAKKQAAEAQKLVPDDADLDAPEAKPS